MLFDKINYIIYHLSHILQEIKMREYIITNSTVINQTSKDAGIY